MLHPLSSTILMDNNEERSVFGQFQSSTFSTYKHQTNGTGESGNNGSLPQPFIPTPNFNLPEEPTSSYVPWSTGDNNPYKLMNYAQNYINRRNLTEKECEGEIDPDLHRLASYILENMHPVESYYTEGDMSTLKPDWSPKTTREDSQQYFEPESKVQPSRAFLQNHTHPFNKAQAQPIITEAEELCQQLNGFDTRDQWCFPSGGFDTRDQWCFPSGGFDTRDQWCFPSGYRDTDAFPQTLLEPPGLSMSRMANLTLSNFKQSEHEYIAADEIGGLSKPVNNELSDLDAAFTPQSKMSTKSTDASYENHASQNGDSSRGTRPLSQQEVKFLLKHLMADERDSSCGRELQNTNKQTMQMHYEDGTVEQRRFIHPRTQGHGTPIMEIQKELGEEFGAAVQKESNGRVKKQKFQGDLGPNGLSGISPEHREYVQQSKLLPSSFKSPNLYQNTTNGNAFLPASLNQYSQHHSPLLQQNNTVQPRVNHVPSVPSRRPVSEFVPQRSQQMERAPPRLQDYHQGDRPAAHRHHHQIRPGQSEMVSGPGGPRRGGGDLGMRLEKNTMMHMAGLPGEGFSTLRFDGNTRPHTNGDIGEGYNKCGLAQKQPCFDPTRNIYGSPRFGGGHGAGMTPQFLPNMYPLRDDPRRSSFCHMPYSSSNLDPRSPLSYGSGVPLLDPRDVLPETPETFTRYLHFYLEECYKQWRSMERERKRTEVFLNEAYPWKQSSGVTGNVFFKEPPNPSRVDSLIIDQMREQARVVSLLGDMERLRSVPLPANITSSLDRHYEAICLTRSRRKDEVINVLNRQRHGGAHFTQEQEVLLLTLALRDLCATTRTARTALLCAFQMTRPKPVKRPGVRVDVCE